MSDSKADAAVEEKLRERLARIQGAATGVVGTVALFLSVGGFMYKGMSEAREDTKLAHAERVSSLESGLKQQQSEVLRLTEENKSILLRLQATQVELAGALDPSKRCGPHYAVVQQKQQIVVDKEARIPSDATTVAPMMTHIKGQPNPEVKQYESYQALRRSADESKAELKRAESDWRACLGKA